MRPFLSAEWRYLLMLNFAVDPGLLKPLVPPGTELDEWRGITCLSVVGFLFRRTLVWGVPVPLHRDFEEVNLRFYVRRKCAEGWRRGVVFIKEIVPRHAIAWVARACYGEPYVALPMRHRISHEGQVLATNTMVEYAWQLNGRWNALRAQITGVPRAIESGSEEEFITEHYWGYTRRSNARCSEYKVEHPRWSVWQLAEPELDCDVRAVYGPRFVDVLRAPCRSAFVAEGSPVKVFVGTDVRP